MFDIDLKRRLEYQLEVESFVIQEVKLSHDFRGEQVIRMSFAYFWVDWQLKNIPMYVLENMIAQNCFGISIPKNVDIKEAVKIYEKLTGKVIKVVFFGNKVEAFAKDGTENYFLRSPDLYHKEPNKIYSINLIEYILRHD